MTRLGVSMLVLAAALGVAAPWVAVHPPDHQHREHVFAPPMPLHLIDDDGRWRTPFYYPIRSETLALRTFSEDRSRPVPLSWLTAGRLATDAADAPWFPLGTDSLGRDIWSRLVYGARLSLGVAAAATLGALLAGALVGALAGGVGGALDWLLMRATELVLVLPLLYVVLALRAAMPLVVPPATLFLLLVVVLAVAGAPQVARGVRAILAAERAQDYAMAAQSIGASRFRLIAVHLLPGARSFLLTQALVLAPAFILAEATLSYVGLGFNPPASSWGAMLQEAANIRAMAEFPWVLAPGLAIAFVTLGLTLASEPRRRAALSMTK
jgi:peptide/nickel transport system permease protein